MIAQKHYEDMKARAERAEAELAKERARLDWFNSKRFDHFHHETGDDMGSEWTVTSAPEDNHDVRSAIDAAMKEYAK